MQCAYMNHIQRRHESVTCMDKNAESSFLFPIDFTLRFGAIPPETPVSDNCSCWTKWSVFRQCLPQASRTWARYWKWLQGHLLIPLLRLQTFDRKRSRMHSTALSAFFRFCYQIPDNLWIRCLSAKSKNRMETKTAMKTDSEDVLELHTSFWGHIWWCLWV